MGNVVLVAIDDRTAAKLGPLPLKRSVLASGLKVLAGFKPRVLALDLLLSEAGDPEDDGALAKSLLAFPRLVLGAALWPRKQRTGVAGPSAWNPRGCSWARFGQSRRRTSSSSEVRSASPPCSPG